MRRLIITEAHGQYIVDTSAGVRAVGATLQSALDKVIPVNAEAECCDDGYDVLRFIFAGIRPIGKSQIHEGQEGA